MGKPFGSGPAGWFQQVFAPLIKSSPFGQHHENSGPGTVWSAGSAERAFVKNEMRSKEGGKKLRVGFRNNSKLPLLLSWVAENGKCHHFYTLKPAQVLEGPVTARDHIEHTNLGHSFCVAYVGDDEDRVRKEGVLDAKHIIGGYRPDVIGADDEKSYAHLVTISQEPVEQKNWMCCSPSKQHYLRGTEEVGNEFDDLRWVVRATESGVDDKQIQTDTKTYEKSVLGGWPVYLEPNWNDGDKALERRLAEDLERAAKCLPKHASDFLKKNTPVYVNRNFKWGPEVCPIVGRGKDASSFGSCEQSLVIIRAMFAGLLLHCLFIYFSEQVSIFIAAITHAGLCFHPESDWLEENCMHVEKCECVELYNAKEYLEICEYWGRAGVLVHEFSHAYHHKCMDKGYDNDEIRECFELAMKEELYNWVRVHGPQGPMNKAYACTNAMEYFAELSAAFLGQPDKHSPEEFNKWYPFNRRQIREHDPRAYEMLKKAWKVKD